MPWSPLLWQLFSGSKAGRLLLSAFRQLSMTQHLLSISFASFSVLAITPLPFKNFSLRTCRANPDQQRSEIMRSWKDIWRCTKIKQVSGSQDFFSERELWYNEENIPSLKPLILGDGIPLPLSSLCYPYWNTSLIEVSCIFPWWQKRHQQA